MYAEQSAYHNLEIKKIISLLAKQCRSELGISVFSSLALASDTAELEERHALFEAIEKYRAINGELPWANGIMLASPLLAEAGANGILVGEELLRIRRLLSLSMRIKDKLAAGKDTFPIFSSLTRNIRDFSEEIEALSVLDDDGFIYDSASEKLKNIRITIRLLRESIRRKGQALLNDPSIATMLQERVMVLRNGRHAFLVRQDALSIFPGIVIDRSASGNSVYMEPASILRLNNEFSSAREIELNEEQRILRELTSHILKRAKAILAAENILGTIDMYFALSKTARLQNWHVPEISKRSLFSFKRVRHPLLFDKAVPIDVKCGEKFRILVITGPNTGGKTVALKTVGAAVLLAWLGFPIPADEGSVIGDIGELFADIGDEQSIEQSLSTFSAHVKHITEILLSVTPRSLILIDELGSGTDPEEGAALGIALLDRLRADRALVLATTHHNPIKRFALAADSVEAASVEFDAATLSPTYKLLIGLPGRSNALLIAGKLGMPEEIIKRAEVAISGKEASMEDLIGELHGKKAALERETYEVEKMRKKMESLKKDYEKKVRDIEEKRDTLIEKADKKAMGIVRNAENSARALIKNMEAAETEQEARRELEKKRSHFSKIESSAVKREEKKIASQSVASSKEPLKVGETVRIIGTNGTASVVELRGKRALVQSGAAQIEVPLTKIGRATADVKHTYTGEQIIQIKVSRPVGVPASIMVRGMTIDEAIPIVTQYLDQAYRAGYDSVTVIHGKGEGILRREVQELCKRTPYVAEHNLGGPHEGGYGVTVVRFKSRDS